MMDCNSKFDRLWQQAAFQVDRSLVRICHRGRVAVMEQLDIDDWTDT